MTRICHVSDTHGSFPALLGKFDLVVHSGDFCPNSQYVWTDRAAEIEFQYRWLSGKIPLIKLWLQGRPFLFTMGNHDFFDPFYVESMLRSEQIDATCLHDRVSTIQNINFYGFPYIPYINGIWNYERTLDEMEPHIEHMVSALNETYVDVLVSHPPLYRCLDLDHSGEHFGSVALANALDFKLISQDMLPSVMMCGHIHGAAAVSIRNGMLVSNAATTQQIIEI